MLLLAVPTLAAAAPSPPSEEIVVYGDDFARWDHTRWWLQAEIGVPWALELAADQNLSFRTHALQVRAVVACEKDARLSARRWEVSCAIEDLGLRVTTQTDWRSPARRAQVQRVLDEVDARLTGASLQLQVDLDGGVTNYDLEGLSATNQREREQQETARTLLSLIMAGFHLRIPDHAQRDGQWWEKHAELLDLPSLTAARGSTGVVHVATPLGTDRLVETVGTGSVTVSVPYVATDPFTVNMASEERATLPRLGGSTGGGGIGPASLIVFPPPVNDPPTEAELTGPPTAGDRVEIGLEASWRTHLSSVAVFRRETGIMTERVWIVTGTPTPSSHAGGGYLNVGRLWILEPGERPDVGSSEQVSWPGWPMEGLPEWIPLPR